MSFNIIVKLFKNINRFTLCGKILDKLNGQRINAAELQI